MRTNASSLGFKNLHSGVQSLWILSGFLGRIKIFFGWLTHWLSLRLFTAAATQSNLFPQSIHCCISFLIYCFINMMRKVFFLFFFFGTTVQLRLLPWCFVKEASPLIGPTLWSRVTITMTTIPTVPSGPAPLRSVNFPVCCKWASHCPWPAAKFYKVWSPDEQGPAPGINHRRRRTGEPRRSMLNDAWSLHNMHSCWQSRTAVFLSRMVKCI